MRGVVGRAKKPCPTCGRYAHSGPNTCPPSTPLACPCGGTVELGGEPAPRYTCGACGKVVASLWELARRP